MGLTCRYSDHTVIDAIEYAIDPSAGYVRCISMSSTARTVTSATVQYTKTTDSAVEIGSDTDYSTTEKIVGTWIDGKPIWQKTVTGTAPNGWGDTAHNIANIDKVINVSCGIIHSNSYIVVGSATDIGRFLCQVGRTNVALYVAPNSYVGDDFICTFQYTKTSS